MRSRKRNETIMKGNRLIGRVSGRHFNLEKPLPGQTYPVGTVETVGKMPSDAGMTREGTQGNPDHACPSLPPAHSFFRLK